MNSNKYNDLLEKYYSGGSSVEEERLLKVNRHLLQESLPLVEPLAGAPVMDWSFEEFLSEANKQQQPLIGALRKMPLVKYAAAIIVMAIVAIAINYTKKDTAVFPPGKTARGVPLASAKAAQAAKDSSSGPTIPVTRKAIVKYAPSIVNKHSIKVRGAGAQQKNDDFFVMVDGRRISNENEALAVLQKSMDALSGDIRQTMTGINNIPKLDVKFK
ncbi:MAG: hypothetical protein H7Y86_14720 [Rhizobacter sp.]|nr:hypothetical protein [Ferruginibacter sp.]